MSKIIRLILLSFFAVTMISCEEDVSVFAPPEFIPVVYCLLNPDDSVQTIRVSRVFQDKRGQLEWQSEYNDYLADTLNRIYIEAIDPTGTKITTSFKWIEQLHPSFDSVFTRTDLFAAKLTPAYGTVYQLYVYYPEIRKMVSAKIITLTKIQLVDPVIVPGRKFTIAPSQPYVVRWFGTPESVYFQGILDLNYLEEENGQVVAKSIKMPLRPVFETQTSILNSQNISGIHFLQTLRDQIPARTEVRRKMAGIDFTFYYGGIELALFANSGYDPKGVEGAVVDFTNLDNGRGLFSSISSVRVSGIPLAPQTMDTIALHGITKSLNFIRSYEDFK